MEIDILRKRNGGVYLIIGAVFTDIMFTLFHFWFAWGVHYSHENPRYLSKYNRYQLCHYKCKDYGYEEIHLINNENYYKGKKIDLLSIRAFMEPASYRNPKMTVILRVDPYSDGHHLMAVLKELRKGGIWDFDIEQLITKPSI